jgi:hypothetical protein
MLAPAQRISVSLGEEVLHRSLETTRLLGYWHSPDFPLGDTLVYQDLVW